MIGAWAGEWRLDPGRLAVAGRFGPTSPHRHPALQLTVALDGKFVASDGHDSRVCQAVLIPSGVRHALSPADDATRVLSIYLHPATADARRLATDAGSGLDDWIARAEHTTRLDLTTTPLDALTATVLTALRGHTPPAPPVPPKLRDAVDLLGALLPAKLALPDLAAAVALSPSTLSRLFATETGATFPTTVRWARLLHAITEIESGRTITDAAHAAGFTDSAHATRVCREMTGVTPTTLVHAARHPSNPILQQ